MNKIQMMSKVQEELIKRDDWQLRRDVKYVSEYRKVILDDERKYHESDNSLSCTSLMFPGDIGAELIETFLLTEIYIANLIKNANAKKYILWNLDKFRKNYQQHMVNSRTPENGIVFFGMGRDDMHTSWGGERVFGDGFTIFVPPEPIKVRFYVCDRIFHLNGVDNMFKKDEKRIINRLESEAKRKKEKEENEKKEEERKLKVLLKYVDNINSEELITRLKDLQVNKSQNN